LPLRGLILAAVWGFSIFDQIFVIFVCEIPKSKLAKIGFSISAKALHNGELQKWRASISAIALHNGESY